MKQSRIGKWILSCLLAVVLVFFGAFFWHYPQYRKNLSPVHVAVEHNDGIRLMSYNLRCLTPLDLGKKNWFYRAEFVTRDIVQQAPGVIGFQEVTRWQYDYLAQTLREYDSVITFRDDTTMSEGCPVFYNKSLYALEEKGAFWLSETPEVMSKSWGSQEYRICSYVVLEDKQTTRDFVVFNVHLDHVSEEARINGMKVILEKIAQLGDLPAVILGDFNAPEDSETYRMATEHFLDARYEAETVADGSTYQGWGDPQAEKRIDYFMVSGKGITVNRYAVIPASHDGIYHSDHNALVMEMSFEPIRMMSHNLRYDSGVDKGNIRWELRKKLILKDIRDLRPGIIGFQECVKNQYQDLVRALPGYKSVIAYSDKEKIAEGLPIFYRPELFDCKDSGMFWLSETPDVMSRGWGAGHYRICTYVVLTERASGKDFAVFNLHLDHISVDAKIGGAEVVLERVAELSSMPVVVLGDFNAQEDSDLYRRVTQELLDARYETTSTSDRGTYHRWGKLEQYRRIDYFMLTPGSFNVHSYTVLPEDHGGIYTSDHSAIMMDVTLRERRQPKF